MYACSELCYAETTTACADSTGICWFNIMSFRCINCLEKLPNYTKLCADCIAPPLIDTHKDQPLPEQFFEPYRCLNCLDLLPRYSKFCAVCCFYNPPLFDPPEYLPHPPFDDSCSQATDTLLVIEPGRLSDDQFYNFLRGRLYMVETIGHRLCGTMDNGTAILAIRAFLEQYTD